MPQPTCAVRGCPRPVKSRGWCSGHYSRWQRHKDVGQDIPLNSSLATPSECGTLGKYTMGCRCSGCVDASREYRRAYRDRARTMGLPPGDPRHGTSSGYTLYGCRCDSCARWRSGYAPLRIARQRRRAKMHGAASEPYTLAEIAARDEHGCQLCGNRVRMDLVYPDPMSPSIDHIVPISDGGSDLRVNVQLAHLVCNLRKGTGGTQQLRMVG